MPEEVVREFSRLVEELVGAARERPELVGRVLDGLGADGYLVKYVLARRGVVI